MTYKVAEKFKSPQGEGVYTGTPMAFIRFVGCSVGKTICQHCDTDFDSMMPWRGGGEFTAQELLEWICTGPRMPHVCLTGGEPLDQDLDTLVKALVGLDIMPHIETSGTRVISHQFRILQDQKELWVCVSPKPGFDESVVLAADEVKVIVPGLGEINRNLADHWVLAPAPTEHAEYPPNTLIKDRLKHWPTLEDALRWAAAGKIVFLQPRNGKNDVNNVNLMFCQDIIRDHPELRLSVQLHKILKVQ